MKILKVIVIVFCFVIIATCTVLCVHSALLLDADEDSSTVEIEGKSYSTGLMLSQFFNKWKIDYQMSSLFENDIIPANSQEDTQIYLTSDAYPSGLSVVVANHTNQDVQYESSTVTKVIFDCSEPKDNSKVISDIEINAGEDIVWGSTTSTAIGTWGTPDQNDSTDGMTILTYISKPLTQESRFTGNIKLYFTETSGLFKMCLY